MSVKADQRFSSPAKPCPICHGNDRDHRGKGERCHGYMSQDGKYAYCAQIESPVISETTDLYVHFMHGACRCGVTHNSAPITPFPTNNKQQPKQKEDQHESTRTPESTVDFFYRHADKTIAYKVTRLNWGEGKKTYAVSHWAKDQWKLGQNEIPRILYHLPEITAASPDTTIYIVEGEKCADILLRQGLVATTSMSGASKWINTPDESRHDPLRDRTVVILPDNDKPGKRHALQVAGDLYGIAGSVKVVALPGLPEKGDIADWLTAGFTIDDLNAVVASAPGWCPEPQDAQEEEQEIDPDLYRLHTDIDVQNLPPMEWAIDKILPIQSLAAIYGEPGKGKTFFSLDLGLHVATGMEWHEHAVKQGPVVYIAAEGLRGLQLRLMAWKFQHHIPIQQSLPIYIIGEAVPLLLPDTIGKLIKTLKHMPVQPHIVFVDTLGRSFAGGEENSNDSMNQACNAANMIQREVGCTVVFVHHKGKNAVGLRGGSALIGGVDTSIEVLNEEDSPLTTIHCEKQKDGADRFQDITLRRIVIPQIIGDLSSCVLVAAEPEDISSELTGRPRDLLCTLAALNSGNGATSTEWLTYSRWPKSTYDDNRKALIEYGWVSEPTGRGGKYILTPKARQWARLEQQKGNQ